MKPRLSPEQLGFIHSNYPSLGARWCADNLGLPYEVVKNKAANSGLKRLPKAERLCPSCKKPIGDIGTRNRSICRACHAVKRREYDASRQQMNEKQVFANLLKALKSRNKIIHKSDTNITVDFLHSLYAKQCGKCYYSGRDMKLISSTSRAFDIVSVDRVDSTKPYSIDNIVLCVWGVNLMKNKFSYDEFVNVCHEVSDRH